MYGRRGESLAGVCVQTTDNKEYLCSVTKSILTEMTFHTSQLLMDKAETRRWTLEGSAAKLVESHLHSQNQKCL